MAATSQSDVEEIEGELVGAFMNLFAAFGRAAEAGLNPQEIMVRELRASMGSDFDQLPITVRMLLA